MTKLVLLERKGISFSLGLSCEIGEAVGRLSWDQHRKKENKGTVSH